MNTLFFLDEENEPDISGVTVGPHGPFLPPKPTLSLQEMICREPDPIPYDPDYLEHVKPSEIFVLDWPSPYGEADPGELNPGHGDADAIL